MVLLSFLVEVDAPFNQVWNFFQKLQNVPQWDPNMKKAQVIKKNQNQVGSVYKLTSQIYGAESVIDYQSTINQESPDRGYRCFIGENSSLKAKDEIIVVRRTENTSRIEWKADLSLRGLWWTFTPLAYFGFKKLQKDGRQGCVKRCIQLFGNARQIQ